MIFAYIHQESTDCKPLSPSDFSIHLYKVDIPFLPIFNDGRVKNICLSHRDNCRRRFGSVVVDLCQGSGQPRPGQRDWAKASEEAKAKTKRRKHNKRVPTAFESKLKSQLTRRRSEDQSVPRRRWVRIGLLAWRMCKWLDGQAKATGSRVQPNAGWLAGWLIAAPKLWACDT